MEILKFTLKKGLYLLAFVFLFSCQKSEDNVLPDNNSMYFVSIDAAVSIASAIDLKNAMSLKRLKTTKSTNRKVKEIIHVSQNNEVSFYVINYKGNKGFVIISADTRQIPILAFSETGNFSMDNINNGLQAWMDDNQNIITEIRNGDIEMPEYIKLLWEEFENMICLIPIPDDDTPSTDEDGNIEWDFDDYNDVDDYINKFIYEEKGPLMETEWAQRNGYNASLTPIDGQLPPAGCVAVAMGQIMKYHNYPVNYNWAAMYNTVATTETADLMRDIGESVGMNYSLEASGIPDDDAEYVIERALENVFGYSTTTHYIDYAGGAYLDVVEELRNSRPVLFKGLDSNLGGGHAWVCDGYLRTGWVNYGTTLSLHMNWGWGLPDYLGNNGYFNFSDFSVAGYNFDLELGCIIGIKP
ncbi:MAG: C10 family peptidase [Bacteroidales bacterium]|nr:C10 family peptidase [Bacteroidales bacterium]